MTDYFLDTSAIVKRYVSEQGSSWIQAITASSSGNTTIIAQITQVEVMSGVNRLVRSGHILARTSQMVRLLLNRHSKQQYLVVQLTSQIVQRAQTLLEVHPLRAYDSVQLACAIEGNLRLRTGGLPPLVFVSADQRLLNAAKTEGLITDDPNLHP